MDVSDATFGEEVLARSHEVPVVVDFWAAWCGPCRMLGPVLERETEAREGRVVLAKVDVDANPALAREYGIQGIPAVKAFKKGRLVDGFVGARSAPSVGAFLDALFAPSEVERLLEELRIEGEWPDVVDAVEAENYEEAFERLLARLDGDRDRVRQLMVALFAELGVDHPLSLAYRRRLSAALF